MGGRHANGGRKNERRQSSSGSSAHSADHDDDGTDSLQHVTSYGSTSSSRPLTAANGNPASSNKLPSAFSPGAESAASVSPTSSPVMGSDANNKLRLRQAARRISLVRNASSFGHYKWHDGTHAEPGIDPTKSDIHVEKEPGDVEPTQCVICDISSERFEMTHKTEANFARYINEESRPKWSKIRWIHVNGISWECIKPLALKFSLHPLAVEDCMHINHESRSKADYYSAHLFLKVITHVLAPGGNGDSDSDGDDLHPSRRRETKSKRSKSFFSFTGSSKKRRKSQRKRDEESRPDITAGAAADAPKHQKQPRLRSRFGINTSASRAIERLTAEYKVDVYSDHLSMFLLRDGTLISVMRSGAEEMLEPIYERLKTPDTILREKEDASMLLQALLDLIVDNLRSITDAYRTQLTELEAQVLANPDTEAVRHLHILGGDLLMLQRSLTPLQNVIYALRRYDAERTLASRPQTAHTSTPALGRMDSFHPSQQTGAGASNNPAIGLTPSAITKGQGEVGFLSGQARVYLSDVLDHLEETTASLELFSSLSQNLVDYTFNIINFNMNESMKGLSIVTIVFLPLTVLTGYFGMNFTDFPDLENSTRFFWIIAIPMIIGATIVFCGSYILDEMKRVSRILKHRSA